MSGKVHKYVQEAEHVLVRGTVWERCKEHEHEKGLGKMYKSVIGA